MVVVTFNRVVAVVNVPRIHLTIGDGDPVRHADYFSGGNTSTLTFRYWVVAADEDDGDGIHLGNSGNIDPNNNGSITIAGASAPLNLPTTAFANVQIDTTAPAAPTVASSAVTIDSSNVFNYPISGNL